MAGDLTFPDGLPVTLQFVGSNIEPNTTTALTLVNGGAGLVVPTGYKFHSMLVFAESNAAVSADTGTVVVRANTTTLGNGPTVALTNTAQSGSDTERVGAEGITAGKTVSLAIVTGANFAPNTADIDAVLVGVLLPA